MSESKIRVSFAGSETEFSRVLLNALGSEFETRTLDGAREVESSADVILLQVPSAALTQSAEEQFKLIEKVRHATRIQHLLSCYSFHAKIACSPCE
jgi:hypothetical protein